MIYADCVWEHNGDSSLIYIENFIGAYMRGRSKGEALSKCESELKSYLRWRDGAELSDAVTCRIVQEANCELHVEDADSDVLFESEKVPLEAEEYAQLKALALRSAEDFLGLYASVSDPDRSVLPPRESFYGPIPRTAREMYDHTAGVNGYYFGEVGVKAGNDGGILKSRIRGFDMLENMADFLQNREFEGSYGEHWTLRKVLRRFIWHDRIHAKAMWRMAMKTFGKDGAHDLFRFEG